MPPRIIRGRQLRWGLKRLQIDKWSIPVPSGTKNLRSNHVAVQKARRSLTLLLRSGGNLIGYRSEDGRNSRLILWEDVIDVFCGGQPPAKSNLNSGWRPLAGAGNEGKRKLTAGGRPHARPLGTMSNIDYVPPSMPPLKGEGQISHIRGQ